MMQSFIEDVCYPNGIERIYLDANCVKLKDFWKNKIGKHFNEKGIFTRPVSSGFEICFNLVPEK